MECIIGAVIGRWYVRVRCRSVVCGSRYRSEANEEEKKRRRDEEKNGRKRHDGGWGRARTRDARVTWGVAILPFRAETTSLKDDRQRRVYIGQANHDASYIHRGACGTRKHSGPCSGQDQKPSSSSPSRCRPWGSRPRSSQQGQESWSPGSETRPWWPWW